jgi:hypothetical protein
MTALANNKAEGGGVANQKDASLPVLERFELKYTVPVEMWAAMENFIHPYCRPDAYSDKSPDGYYRVNSLYFDSPDFHFLRNRLDRCEKRFNLRVRSYGDDPKPPYFFEIKRKTGDVIRKERARYFDRDVQGYLAGGPDDALHEGDRRPGLEFRRLVQVYGAEPVVMTQYRRRAYFSDTEDYARVTFDVDMRSMTPLGWEPKFVEEGMSSSDPETWFDPGTHGILELKCYTLFTPKWMLDMIRAFELRRRGFSKYTVGMERLFRQRQFDTSDRCNPLVNFTRGEAA